MTRTKEDLLAETRELWGRRYGRPITNDEALEIIYNVTGFARILIDWYLADNESADRSLAEPSTSLDAPPSCRE